MGTCASGIGALAHVSAGGSAPPLPLLALLALGVTGSCVLASRWRWSLPALTGVMVLAQLVFHDVFTGYGGHGAHAMHSAQPEPGLTVPMAVSHVVAGLGLALLLRFGESWLRRVVDALGTLLLRLIRSWWSLAPRRPQIAVPATGSVPAGHGPATTIWSRGPPQ